MAVASGSLVTLSRIIGCRTAPVPTDRHKPTGLELAATSRENVATVPMMEVDEANMGRQALSEPEMMTLVFGPATRPPMFNEGIELLDMNCGEATVRLALVAWTTSTLALCSIQRTLGAPNQEKHRENVTKAWPKAGGTVMVAELRLVEYSTLFERNASTAHDPTGANDMRAAGKLAMKLGEVRLSAGEARAEARRGGPELKATRLGELSDSTVKKSPAPWCVKVLSESTFKQR